MGGGGFDGFNSNANLTWVTVVNKKQVSDVLGMIL